MKSPPAPRFGRCRGACAAALVVLAACAPALRTLPGEAVANPVVLADSLRLATVPASPRQASFSWTLNESGTRLQGRGVARFEAPRRLRVDLFGPRGETYLSAALVGDSVRLRSAAPAGVALPSPALLWGALGVVRPPTGAAAVAGSSADTAVSVRYRAPDDEVFLYHAGTTGLRSVQRLRGGRVVESVELQSSDAGIRRAEYRDWAAYRGLVLDFESFAESAPFSDEIWLSPDAAR